MNLSGLKMPQLRDYAKTLGVVPKQHESRESLLTRIAIVAYPEQKPPVKAVAKPVEAAPHNTADEVLDRLRPFIERGAVISINGEDNTWHAAYRGAENSGTLSMPLSAIVKQVELYVMPGARHPRFIKDGELAGAFG